MFNKYEILDIFEKTIVENSNKNARDINLFIPSPNFSKTFSIISAFSKRVIQTKIKFFYTFFQ